MLTLIRFELKKLFTRKSIWIVAALCVGLQFFSDIWMIDEKTNGRVQGIRDVCQMYEGRLRTEELISQARASFNEYIAAHPDRFDASVSDDGSTIYFSKDHFSYEGGLWEGYMDIIQGETMESRLKRADAIEKDLREKKDGDVYTRAVMAARVAALRKPAVVHYAYGWSSIARQQQTMGIFTLFLLALSLLSVFSGERSARMESILLGAARRRQGALAKLAAMTVFALMTFLLLYGQRLLMIALTYGIDGANAPVSTISFLPDTAGMTVGSLFGTAALISLAAALASAAAAALSSALLRRHPLLSLLGFGLFIGFQMMLLAVRSNHFFWNISLSSMPLLEQTVNMLPACVLCSSDTLLNTVWNAGNVALGLGISIVLIALTVWLAPRLFLRRRKA